MPLLPLALGVLQQALLAADVIICTPEKWDGISRNWRSRGYVRQVGIPLPLPAPPGHLTTICLTLDARYYIA